MNKLMMKMTMIAGVAAMMMIAGSAQAQSAGRSLSIQADGDRITRDSIREALRSGIGVLLEARNEHLNNGRPGWDRPRGPHHPRPRPVLPPRPRPEPVTAVPEPGAALLFGAGIVLAGLRRR